MTQPVAKHPVPHRGGRRWARSLAASLASAALLSAAVTTAATPAGAAPNQYAPSQGTVSSLIPEGTITTAFSVRTTGACPAGTSNINAYVDRPDAGWREVPAISANTAPDTITTGIPLNNTLLGIAGDSQLTLTDGSYQFSLVCYPDFFGTPPTAQFDGGFTVTGNRYTWVVPGVTATTTTAAVAPPGGASVGSPVTLSAQVTPASAVGAVQFSDTGSGTSVDVGARVPLSGGLATLSTSALAAGNHTLKATFVPGNASFATSASGPLPYTVTAPTQTLTTVALSASPIGTAAAGTPVTFSATIAPVAAAGSVTFTDAATGAVLGASAAAGGVATVTTSSLAIGDHRVVAQFVPDDPQTYAAATSSALAYTVTEAGTPPPPSGTFLDFMRVTTPPDLGAGTSASSITLTTPSGCPSPADTAAVTLVGPRPWNGGVRASASGAVSTDTGFTIQVETVAQTAAAAGLSVVPGKYFYQLSCTDTLGTGSFGFFIGQLWFYDSTHWLNQDPAIVGIPTTTAVTVGPPDRSVARAPVVLTATVSPALTGTVKFENSDPVNPTDLASAPVRNGTATVTFKNLAVGLYYVAATFVPATSGVKYVGSRSSEVIYAITKPAPPKPPKAATITGTVAVGRALTCAGRFQGAKKVTYAWLRDQAPLSGATRAGYRVAAADRGHRLRCQIAGTNDGGTVIRISAAVTVRG